MWDNPTRLPLNEEESMNRWAWIFLCFFLAGCETTDDGADVLGITCECSPVAERLTPTFTCTASETATPVFLCEDGEAGLECEETPSTTWSAEDLSCSTVFCVTTDPSTCQVDCSCSESSGG